MSKYAKRTDGNHGEIRECLRECSWLVVKDTSMFGNGFPDLLVRHKFGGQIYFIEIKKDKKAKLTKAEQVFREFIGKQNYCIVTSKEDVYRLLSIEP